jgi:hypothetical protein
MSEEKLLLGYWHNLLLEQQNELIQFAEFIQTKSLLKIVRKSGQPFPARTSLSYEKLSITDSAT